MGRHPVALHCATGTVRYLAGLPTISHPRFTKGFDGGLTEGVQRHAATALADGSMTVYLGQAHAYHRWCRDNGIFTSDMGGAVPFPTPEDQAFYIEATRHKRRLF